MAHDVHAASKPAQTKKNLSSTCSVCQQVFKSLPECLKHELISHSLQKKKAPNSAFVNRQKSAAKFLKSPEKLEERAKVHQLLQKCPKGKEVATILKQLCMDNDSLNLIFTRIQTCLEKDISSLGPVQIYPFGSIASGLALRDCDIDIYMDASKIPTREFSLSPKHRIKGQKESPRLSQEKGSFNRINYVLQRSPNFSDIFPVRKARVPIIKCKHLDTGFSIDINVCCRSSLDNTNFIRDLVYSDMRIRELLLFLKLWAKHMQIIGQPNLTSYCLITMVIFYLQQPWKQKTEEGESQVQILKSIKELQRNCPPKLTEGINYSYDLLSKSENRLKIPKGITTTDLLTEFFRFYKEFNFDDYIVSPFLGKAINKKDFQNLKEYRNQLISITQYNEGEEASPFALDRCMCVQDSFALNHNVARSMMPPSKQYFILCLENAYNLCKSIEISSAGDVLEELIYEPVKLVESPTNVPSAATISKSDINLLLQKAEISNVESEGVAVKNISKDLCYLIEPRKADLSFIANLNAHLTEPTSLLRLWCEHLVENIPKCLSAFYHIDMQTQMQTPLKQQRLDNAKSSYVWNIAASVDLWSNRFFQKSQQQTFWQYQMEQTQRLHELRRQDSAYAVNINALMGLSILPDYMGINLTISLQDGSATSELSKKDPLRKFFNAIKNTLQNYSLKEALAMDNCNKEKETKDESKEAQKTKEN